MAQATVSIVGSLGQDPELRFTASGAAVVNFSVAVTERVKDGNDWKDGDTTWYRANAWRNLAENIAESLKKGDQVVILGRIKNRPYDKDGQTRYSLEVDVEAVGPSLQFATARPQKASRSNAAGGQGRNNQSAQDDPWGSAPVASGNFGNQNPPF
ncbi:single-stranded DNA-binding protein [Rhodococcoides fascians]|uniref:single-stranded DNA-binding protein n=1 Tax=Rhodococcoides fascians TaxID=1828 RepID=UPI000569BD04|nr:single-stranded DNA-binding protein [Rhodococcus fascians]